MYSLAINKQTNRRCGCKGPCIWAVISLLPSANIEEFAAFWSGLLEMELTILNISYGNPYVSVFCLLDKRLQSWSFKKVGHWRKTLIALAIETMLEE